MKKRILVLHGANMNLLGFRDSDFYGKESLPDVNTQIFEEALKMGFEVDTVHSNIEGEIINAIHAARGRHHGIIINPGAYAHYSYAIRDAIAAVVLPCIEVHISNIYAREEFRKSSVIAPVCSGQIAGLGKNGYLLALSAMKDLLDGEVV